MNATIEEQGMLKILEHLAHLLLYERKATLSQICDKVGLETKYFTKLVQHGLIERGGSGNSPIYKWATIKPNIYMAREVLKDASDFSNSTDASLVAAFDLAEHPYFKYGFEEIKTQDNVLEASTARDSHGIKKKKQLFIENNLTLCDKIFANRNTLSYHINTAEEREFAARAKEIIGYSDSTGLGDILRGLHSSYNTIVARRNTCRAITPIKRDRNIINIKFDDFWNLYDKKVGDKYKLETKWIKLSDKDRADIMEYIPKYKEAQPDKQFRKDPQTFLNNGSWHDEIITKTFTKIIPQIPTQNNYPLSHFTDQQIWDELKRRGYTGTITKALE